MENNHPEYCGRSGRRRAGGSKSGSEARLGGLRLLEQKTRDLGPPPTGRGETRRQKGAAIKGTTSFSDRELQNIQSRGRDPKALGGRESRKNEAVRTNMETAFEAAAGVGGGRESKEGGVRFGPNVAATRAARGGGGARTSLPPRGREVR